MKNIKTLLIAGLLISSTGTFAQQKTIAKKKMVGTSQQISQKKSTAEDRATKETEVMKNTLGLSDSQVSRVSVLNLKVEEKIQTILDSNMSDSKKKEFIEGNMNDKLNVLSTILSKEQLAKYKASLSTVKL